MAETIVNKVSESGLITLDLELFYPAHQIRIFDLKDYLFMEAILKEKDFRAALLQTDWTSYHDCLVGITCSADAIIPVWANMLVASNLQPLAREIIFGDEAAVIRAVITQNIRALDASAYRDQRVVVK